MRHRARRVSCLHTNSTPTGVSPWPYLPHSQIGKPTCDGGIQTSGRHQGIRPEAVALPRDPAWGRAAAFRLSPEHAEHRVPRQVNLIPAFDHLQAVSRYTDSTLLGADHTGTCVYRYVHVIFYLWSRLAMTAAAEQSGRPDWHLRPNCTSVVPLRQLHSAALAFTAMVTAGTCMGCARP